MLTARTIGIFSRNMLFLDNVGPNVRANLPKLRRHLPPAGRDLQILQIQFCQCQFVLFEGVGPTKWRSADRRGHTRYLNGSRTDRDQHLAALTYSGTS